ncbi:hypothetical protein HPB51_013319 [Rhipicephalus microplus]|uniref:Transposase Helix-turn-helix domain-containing protein n=1 Tax=Rhipicephalus microplus TaxID=6941 RepID=A0A9J6DGV7_RHIMP|nr:hypothetical protein HPB51_013319 [Rhipicephalus microplus]
MIDVPSTSAALSHTCLRVMLCHGICITQPQQSRVDLQNKLPEPILWKGAHCQPELPNSPTVAPQHDPEVSGSAITSSSSDSEDTAQQSTLLMYHAYSSQESSYDQLAKKVACQTNIITELAEKAEAAYAHVEELNRQLKHSQQDHAEAKKLCDRLQQKNRCLRLELSCMQKKVKRCKAEATQKIDITYEALVEDEKKLRYYTGFTSRKSFDSFWSLLEPDAKKLRFWQMKETENEDRNFILPLKTQLVLVLMRLRLGLDGLDLAYRFGVSTSTVSRIWVTWLDFLDNRLRQHPGTQHVNPPIVRRLHTTEKSIEKGTLRHFGWLVRPDDYKYRHAPRLPRQRWRRETGLWDRSILLILQWTRMWRRASRTFNS